VDLTLVKSSKVEIPTNHIKNCDGEPAGLSLLTKWTSFGNSKEKATEYAVTVNHLPSYLWGND